MANKSELRAFVGVCISYETYVFGMLISKGTEPLTQATFIIAFLCFTSVFVLSIIAWFGELNGNKVVQIVNITLLFVSAAFIIIGETVWKTDSVNSLVLVNTSWILAIGSAAELIIVVRGANKTEPNQMVYPNNTIPNQMAYPNDTIPNQMAYPNNTTPNQMAYPNNTIPNQMAYPNNTIPNQMAYPNNTIPNQMAYPNNTVPNQMAYPNNTIMYQTTYPNNSIPNQMAYPNNTTQ